jgi:hypothetical protein
MSAEVEFVRVVPAEIEKYGFAGATFVAHIRYRCMTDGPGRFVVDGVRWWRVTLAELAAELHVSKDVAQRTMKRLGNAVAAKHFGEPWDQTRAYHVPAHDADLTTQDAKSHRLDHSERESAPAERDSAPDPTRNHTGPDAESRFVLLTREGEEVTEEEGEARAREHEPPGRELVPARQSGTHPLTQLSAGPSKAKNERGTRLPDDWMPAQSVIDSMRDQHPHVDLHAEHAKFVDYWQDQPGVKGRKVDWAGTWRNWIRRAAEQTPTTRRRGSNVAENVGGWLDLGRQVAEDEGSPW